MTEAQYIKFLREVYVKANGQPLSESSIWKYSRQTTNKIDQYIRKLLPGSGYNSIYDVDTIEELKEIQSLLNADPDYIRDNKIGDKMYSSGFKLYIEFAEGLLISQFSKDTAVLDIKEPIPKPKSPKRDSTGARDPMKIAQAKGACKYCCQIDENHKTFTSVSNLRNYVEGHHIIPLSCQSFFNYSLDVLANIIVLCPNCHRLFHYAIKPERIDKLYQIYDERYERFNNTGILTDRQTFVEMAMH